MTHTTLHPGFTLTDTHAQTIHVEAKPPSPQKVDWPQPVREYVQRSFAPEYNIPGIGREEMERTLKKVITEAAENSMLHVIDWESKPLPQELIQKERAAQITVPLGGRVIPPLTDRSVDYQQRLAEIPSKKRKSSDMTVTDADNETLPPWRRTNERNNVFEDRISYSSKTVADRVDKRQRKMQENGTGKGLSKYDASLEKRKQRFENSKPAARSPRDRTSSRDDSPTPDAGTGPVVGTCQQLEKKYFRLTSAPKPETVRPLPILQQTLELLKKKWKKENNYSYICDQFKSLRQDLTVQHIKNEFTVSVYEIHARIALEKKDLGEYNQCQTQLRALYSQNLGGHPAEFQAYRILYFIHTCNRTDMNDVLADLTPTDKQQPAVKHALEVRSALALGNYHRFFRLYLDTPNMGAYLMDMFIIRERLAALANICKA